MMNRMILALAMVGGLASVSRAGDDLVIADFEGSTCALAGDGDSGCTVRPGQKGKGWSARLPGRRRAGTLTSPPFGIYDS